MERHGRTDVDVEWGAAENRGAHLLGYLRNKLSKFREGSGDTFLTLFFHHTFSKQAFIYLSGRVSNDSWSVCEL